ncbi:MAG: YfhO family protein [Coriobacteriia bacterium]|nr:YfhO family protein [Coriobacteriia bacterium]
MKKATDWLIGRRGYEYFAAPLLALAILCAAFAARGIYPFGDLSVAIWDMDIQYVGLFGWLSNVMHGQGSLAYSFSAGMGEGMASTIAYYLASPFNLLAWFFDAEHAPQLMSWLTLAKLSTAALTCYAFLRRRHRPGFIHVVLAVAYALCGWSVAQCSNIMWLDGLIMLPLVALGTWRAVEQGRCLTLFLSVAGAVLFNWYSGYMDCLFSVFYFFVCWLEQPRGRRRVRQGLRYGATMLLALGASMALFLPAIIGLLNSPEGGGSLLSNVLQARMSCNPIKAVAGFALGVTPSSDWAVTPALYTGELALVLAGAFLANPGASRRARLLNGGLLAFMVVCMCVWPLDIMWSSFKHVTSYYFRYAYVVSFVLVVVAARGWEALDGVRGAARARICAVSAGSLAVLVGGAQLAYRVLKHEWLTGSWFFAADMAMLVACAALVWLAGEERRVRARSALACACVLSAAALGVNAWRAFGHYSRSVDYWGLYTSQMRAACDELPRDGEQQDIRVAVDGLTAVGQGRDAPTTTEGLLLGVSSPQEYTSTLNGAYTGMLASLGYSSANEIFGYYYRAAMPAADALLGVDYLVSQVDVPLAERLALAAELPADGYGVWRSEVALPSAYGIRSGAGDVAWPSDMSDFDYQTDLNDHWEGSSPPRDPFANQEAMWADMTGSDASGLYAEATAVEDESAATEEWRAWTITVSEDGPLYLFVPMMSALRYSFAVGVNGSWVSSVGFNFNNGVIYLGEYSAGEQLRVSLELTEKYSPTQAKHALTASSSEDLIQARTLNTDELKRLRSLVDEDAAQVETFEDGRVRLSFTASEDETLCTVIPYDSGWSVTVDGEKAEVRALYGGLCGVDLSAGEHTVEFTYRTPGLLAGCAVCAASVVVFGVWREVARRRAGGAPRKVRLQ